MKITSKIDSHTATDVKLEMEFHMINIMYAELPMRTQREKTTFSCKDDCKLTKHKRHWTYSPLRLQYDLCRTNLGYISLIGFGTSQMGRISYI